MALAGVARSGDTISGTCNNHVTPVNFTGTWNVTRTSFTVGGLSIVLVGDTCPVSCGHTVVAAAGSAHSTKSGVAIHRNGDLVNITIGGGSGTTTSGSLTFQVY